MSSPASPRLRVRGSLVGAWVAIAAFGALSGQTTSKAGAVTGSLAVGISDNKPSTFSDPRLTQTGIRTARLVIPWDAISRDPVGLAAWLTEARRLGVQPLVAFDRTRVNKCPAAPCYLPSVREYQREFARFHRAYPWVKYVTPWNEANHPGQPTAKRPERVADFHNALLKVCRRCVVVAGDPLDSTGVTTWMRRYERSLQRKHRRKVRIWGIHNYVSANYFMAKGTADVVRATKADIWLTETGGIVQMLTFDETRLNYDEQRAARALDFAFTLKARYPCRIKRIYVYNWQAVHRDRFDTGVISPDGAPRPAFAVLTAAMQPTAPVQNGPSRCAALRAARR